MGSSKLFNLQLQIKFVISQKFEYLDLLNKSCIGANGDSARESDVKYFFCTGCAATDIPTRAIHRHISSTNKSIDDTSR